MLIFNAYTYCLSLLCSPGMHLFGRKCSKNSNMVKLYYHLKYFLYFKVDVAITSVLSMVNVEEND